MSIILTGLVLVYISHVNSAPIAKPAFYIEQDYGNADDVGEFGNFFEGDIVLDKEQKANLRFVNGMWRNGLQEITKRWPENTVVYSIDMDEFNATQVAMIHDALEDISNNSCVKFKERQGDEHAVVFKGGDGGCYSSVGNREMDSKEDDGEPSEQILNLSKNCFVHGTIVHEMLHTLGFFHMQSTYDRDDYVKIHWEYIRPGLEHNFLKYDKDTVTNFGVQYDYGSVMHYPRVAFSVNGEDTISPLQANVTIGQRKGMSESDIKKLNKMYCEARTD